MCGMGNKCSQWPRKGEWPGASSTEMDDSIGRKDSSPSMVQSTLDGTQGGKDTLGLAADLGFMGVFNWLI